MLNVNTSIFDEKMTKTIAYIRASIGKQFLMIGVYT